MPYFHNVKPFNFFAVVCLFIFSHSLSAQTEISLIKGEKLKKENNRYGITYNKEWTVPCKYIKLEAYAWNYVFAYTEDEVDVYSNGPKKPLIHSKLPLKYIDLFKSFANTNIDPQYADGKWGFSTKYYKIAPQYDSIFVMCVENSANKKENWSCDDVIGVTTKGASGVVKANGEVIILSTEYIAYKARFTDGAKGKHEIVATHKTGIEITYDMFNASNNDFIIFTGKNDLKGFVIKGILSEPRYTAINKSSLTIADFECVLPDGEIEYRKGLELVPNETVAEHKSNLNKKLEKEIKNAKFREYAQREGLSVELKTQSHTLNVYPGWSAIFKNTEKSSRFLISETGKPSEVFKEAPAGWLKNETSHRTLHIIFDETSPSSFEKSKQALINLAMNRTGWARDKIKPVEESVTLPDGRKGMVLFYVCPDTKGMVGGNYFDCKLCVQNDENISCYTISIDGGCPDLPVKDTSVWKDYFKKVLLTIRPN